MLFGLAGVCALLTVALGVLVPGVDVVVAWPHGVLRALVLPTEPYVLLPVLALLIAWCLYRKRHQEAWLVALGPAIAVAANTWLLKPLFDRWKGGTLVYPSGHTVSMVATVVVVFLLTRGLARAITVIAGVILLISVTIGMMGLGYHYLTDIIGGALFAVAAVLVAHGLLMRVPR
jgi:membrane-associated phospholipid phosphatase